MGTIKANTPRAHRTWARIKEVMAKYPTGISISQLSKVAFLSQPQLRAYMEHYNQSVKGDRVRQVYIRRREVVGSSITFFWSLGKQGNAPEWKCKPRSERRRNSHKALMKELRKDEDALQLYREKARLRTRIAKMLRTKKIPDQPFMFKPRKEDQMQA